MLDAFPRGKGRPVRSRSLLDLPKPRIAPPCFYPRVLSHATKYTLAIHLKASRVVKKAKMYIINGIWTMHRNRLVVVGV